MLGLNEEDRYWLFKCMNSPDLYQINIDVDAIYVANIKTNEALHQFALNGACFIEQLLDFIGCTAEII